MEALMVLGVLTVILGAVMVFMSQSSDRDKVIDLQQEVLLTRNVISDMYAGGLPATKNLTSADDIGPTLSQTGLIPQRFNKGTGGMVTPFGTHMNIFINAYNPSINPNSIDFQINGLSHSQCVLLADVPWDSSSNIVGESVNGTFPPATYPPSHFCYYGAGNYVHLVLTY